jgi:hypothetical protein
VKKYFIAFFVLLAIALNVSYENQIFIVPLAWIIVAVVDAGAFKLLRRWRFILFLAVLVLGTPLFIGDRAALFMGIQFSPEILRMNLAMAHRSIIILLSIRVLTDHIPIGHISQSLNRLGLPRLSRVVAISFQMLPQIKSMSIDSYNGFRQDKRGRSALFKGFDQIAMLMARLLVFADRIAENSAMAGEPSND